MSDFSGLPFPRRGATWSAAVLPLLALIVGACDPIYVRRVVARPAAPASTFTGPVSPDPLVLVQRIAHRWQMTSGANQPGYADCYWRRGVNVCARTAADSIEVRVQAFPISWRTLADSVRRELQDSLSARYGPSRVLLRE
jgi:hypothetical protein